MKTYYVNLNFKYYCNILIYYDCYNIMHKFKYVR